MRPRQPSQAPSKAISKIPPIQALLASLSTVVVTTAGISGGVAVLALGASAVSLSAAAAITAVVVGQVAAAVAAAKATTYITERFVPTPPAPPNDCSHFDRVLAAGTGLLEACVAAQTANTFTVIKSLRLVSKAASKIALNGITGCHIQLGQYGECSLFGNLGAVSAILRNAKVTRLTITAPQPQECPAGSSTYSGTQLVEGWDDTCLESIVYQMGHVSALVARHFRSVTHLKMVAGSFSSLQHRRITSLMSSCLATSFPLLQELSIDTDIGVDMLKHFGSLCPHLSSLTVHDMGTLPFSTMEAMHVLMPNVTRHTVMCTYGDASALSEAINQMCYPTTFDLCGRTILLTSTLHLTKDGVTLQNGTFVVFEREVQPDSLVAIYVRGCSVVLRDILLCDSSSKHSSWAENIIRDSQSSMVGNKPTTWTGIHIHTRGSLVLQRCEIRGAQSALLLSSNVVEIEAGIGLPPLPICTLTCEHVTIHCTCSEVSHVSGLRVQGGGCSAVLTHCVFMNGGARTVHVEQGGHLTATHVQIYCNTGCALSLIHSGVARLTACKVSGRRHYNIFVHGFNSVLYLSACKLNGLAQTEHGGRVHVLEQ